MMRWIAACMLALAGVCSMAVAQVPEMARFRVLGSRQGLPTTVVNALDRDRAGFVWVATNDGLVRSRLPAIHHLNHRHQALNRVRYVVPNQNREGDKHGCFFIERFRRPRTGGLLQ